MKRATVTTAAVLVLVSSFAGCPSQNPDAARNETSSPDDNTPAVDARLMVTNTLRAACPYFGDDDLAVFVAATEQWRLDGYGLAQVVADYFSGCDAANSGLGSPTCYACGLAVFDQVYANDPELAAVEAMPRPNFDGKWTLIRESGPEACVEIEGDVITVWDPFCCVAFENRSYEEFLAEMDALCEREAAAQESCEDEVRHTSHGLSPAVIAELVRICEYYRDQTRWECEREVSETIATAQADHEADLATLQVTVTSQPFVFSHGVAAWGFTSESSDGIIRAHSLLIVVGTDPPAGYIDGFPATLTP